MVQAVAGGLSPYLDVPFALFGHSMGAIIAFELARYLRRSAAPGPVALIVAACKEPGRLSLDPRIYHLPRDAFLDEVCNRYQAIPPAVRANAELMELVEPVLRADFEALDNYTPQADAPLSFPILALGGSDDRAVSSEDLGAWARHTTGPFEQHAFPGDHFFVRSAEARLITVLAETLLSRED